jgi:hypothetical protein
MTIIDNSRTTVQLATKETQDGNASADDDISLWSRYSAHLNEGWANEIAAGKNSLSTTEDTATDAVESLDREALVFAYRPQLSNQELIDSRNISPVGPVETGESRLDESANAYQHSKFTQPNAAFLELTLLRIVAL